MGTLDEINSIEQMWTNPQPINVQLPKLPTVKVGGYSPAPISDFMKMIVPVLIALLLGITEVHADRKIDDPQTGKLINVYLNESLGNPDQRLRKFDVSRPLILQLKCALAAQRQCENLAIGTKFQESVQTGARLKFVVNEDVPNPDFMLIYVDKTTTQATKRQLISMYLNEIVDADDEECQLYLKLRDNKIESVKIVVSADSSDFKQKACLAIQTFRGLGLALYDGLPFSKLWIMGPPNGYADLNETEFSKLIKTMGVFTYIHMCPDLKPGMNAQDVLNLMNKNLDCIHDLKPLSNN